MKKNFYLIPILFLFINACGTEETSEIKSENGFTTAGKIGSKTVIYFAGDGRGNGLGYSRLFMSGAIARQHGIELRSTRTVFNPQHIARIPKNRNIFIAGFSNGVDTLLSGFHRNCTLVKRIKGFIAFRGKTLGGWTRGWGKNNRCNHQWKLALQVCDSNATLGCEKGFEHNVKFVPAVKSLVSPISIKYLGQGRGHFSKQNNIQMAAIAKIVSEASR